jgi:pyruvate dehydrogenase E2 component (dihydrolipoamide acetyltransferase)
MAVSVVMPALEMAQETGKLLSWRKQEGDAVTKGEPLLEIETDKAVVEIEAPGDGILSAVSAREGAVVPVGAIIAWLVKPGEPAPSSASPARTGRQSDAGLSAIATSSEPVAGQGAAEIRISPKARRLATQRGIDPATIKGSGPGGEVLAGDIPELAGNGSGIGNLQSESGNLQSESGNLQSESGNLKSELFNLQSRDHSGNLQSELFNLQSRYHTMMAERTAQSWTSVPHFFLTREVEANGLVAARERFGSTHSDLLVALVARALTKHPVMNASWIDGGIRANSGVHVAIAIATDDAVVAGVIHHADRLSMAEIGVRRKELIDRARAGRLQPADISGATFTISNLGMYHVDAFTAIIVPPQAGILAVGAIADRVVAVDGQPAVRAMITLTLSCDHRVVDGARGAAFLDDVVNAIKGPDARWVG